MATASPLTIQDTYARQPRLAFLFGSPLASLTTSYTLVMPVLRAVFVDGHKVSRW
jgi:hypothetical protein